MPKVPPALIQQALAAIKTKATIPVLSQNSRLLRL
jgi:hypothetical protein